MDLSGRLTSTITVQSQSGSDAAGDPTLAVQRTIAARVAYKQQRVVTAEGTSVQGTHQVLSDQVLLPTDLIWLPGADTSTPTAAKRVLSVGSADELAGSTTLYLAVLG